jgi:serine/threonine protein kinase
MTTITRTWFLDEQGQICCRKEDKENHYKFGREVGVGTQGRVWTILKEDGQGKAKIAKISKTSLQKEYEFSLKYPKSTSGLLLRPKGYISGAESIIIMHEYEGNIAAIISTMNKDQKIEVISQLCKGISTLHTLNIIHRDIHLRNILYDSAKNRYDLGDFGYSIESQEKEWKCQDIFALKKIIESILIGQEAPQEFISVQNHSISHSEEESQEISALLDAILANHEIRVPSVAYVQRLNKKEDVLFLGFSDEAADLIIQFMCHTPDNMGEIIAIFEKIKNLAI